MGGLLNDWDLESFLLHFDDCSCAGGHDWHLLLDDVLFDLPNSEFSGHLAHLWDQDLGGVVLPELDNVGLIDGDLEWDLLPLSLFEFAFDVVWLLLVLGHSNLARDDVWDLLHDRVVDPLGALVWDDDVLFIWNLVEDGVWNLLGHDVGDVEADLVRDLSGGGVWDDDLFFVGHLSLDRVWDLFGDFSRLEGLDLVLLGDVLGVSKLVGHLLDGHDWDLLGNLVLLGLVLGDSVDVSVVGGVSGGVVVVASGLSPSVVVPEAKSSSTKPMSSIEKNEVASKSKGTSSCSVGSICSSLAGSELSTRNDKLWLGLYAISRVVGVLTDDLSLDGHVSGAGLVLSPVGDGLLIPEGSLVGDDWNLAGLDLGDWDVLHLVDSVVSSLLLVSVLGHVLDSSLLIEDRVVSGLTLLSVEDLVLVGVAGLWLVSVEGVGVWSLEDLDLGPVAVLLLLSVEDLVVGLVGGEWDVLPPGLGVVAEGEPWLPCVSGVDVGSVLDLVGLGVSDLLLWSVLGDLLSVGGGYGDLSSSDLGLELGVDLIVSLLVEDWNVSELGLGAIADVGVLVFLWLVSIFDSYGGDSSDQGGGEFHLRV